MKNDSNWTVDSMLMVELDSPEGFLKICETLTRIGIAARTEKKLVQSCHLLHRRGMYFIVHFKELFLLDGKPSTLTPDDIKRRNDIASMLQAWGLLKIVNPIFTSEKMDLSDIKILSFDEKDEWELVQKYKIGQKRNI